MDGIRLCRNQISLVFKVRALPAPVRSERRPLKLSEKIAARIYVSVTLWLRTLLMQSLF
jgi:hypothetical protein